MPRKKNSKNDGYDYFQLMSKEGLIDIPHHKKVEKDYEPKKPDAPKKLRYRYVGAVYRFDKLVIENADLVTYAVSEEQAINNVLFRVKAQMGYPPYTGGFKLPGKLIIS